jgi:hypothetical protein
MVLVTNFQKQNSGKVIIIDVLSVQTVTRDRSCVFQSLSLLLEEEGQYNRLGKKLHNKSVLYLKARSLSHHLHFLVKLRVKNS